MSGKSSRIEFIQMSADDQERLREFIDYKQQIRLSVKWRETPLCVAY